MDRETEIADADTLKRVVALLAFRAGINNLRYTKFELDNAPIATVLVTRDQAGDVNVSMES